MMLGAMVAMALCTADAGADAGTWVLRTKLGPGTAARERLLTELTRPDGGVGEQPLSREKAEAILDDERAQLVYVDKTVSIVAPSMMTRHRQDHLDLMKLFLAPERLKAGAEFAVKHAPLLARVEAATKVDREVIIGILMWESQLGTITGDYRAFNVFTSQAFFIDEANTLALAKKSERGLVTDEAQARRVETIRARATKNLIALLRQCQARGIDALNVRGSWAGALGFPQFMPASLQWAEDGNGDGVIDLFTFDDSIASIGRYLQAHGFSANRQKAVWGYNHEDAYVQGVLAFADALAVTLGRRGDAGVADAVAR
ncbi:MAG: lytic murein transglycosylase [Archangium sp.]|nr:lytic murein transglycosylase [Archangium sp.]